MSSIDNRIVQMQFKNKNFQSGVKSTLGALENLKKGLNFSGAVKGLGNIGKNFTLGGMSSAIERVKGSFGALQVAGVTALATITNKAVNAGIQLGKSLFIDSKKAGFDEYELKMGSIQTIMAGTGADLDVVNGKLNELNEYSDKTIYSFADMTDSIGKFTNAGVDLDLAVESVRGIANAAALSGASSADASRAMYNFSQALSQGSVRLQDWMSIENANMATEEFRTELIKSAEAAGTLKKKSDGVWETMKGNEVTVESFRNTLADQWLTSEALTGSLSKYADETTDLGRRAKAAASEIKTGTMLLDTWNEAAASGWSESFEIIIGDFEEAKKLWTGVNEAIEPILKNSADSRNAMLREWKEMGGRSDLFRGISNIFESLVTVVNAVKGAFRDIFPKSETNVLFLLTSGFVKLTETFKIGAGFADRIKGALKGVFAVFKIILGVLSSAGSFLLGFLTPLAGIGRGLLSMASAVGIVIGRFAEWLAATGFVQEFFGVLSTARDSIIVPLAKAFELVGVAFEALAKGNTDVFFKRIGRAGEIVQEVVSGISETLGDFLGTLGDWSSKLADFFKGIGDGAFDGLAEGIEWVSEAMGKLGDVFDAGAAADVAEGLNPLGKAGAVLKAIWEGVADFFAGAGEFFAPLTDSLGKIGGKLKNYVDNFDMTDAVALFNAGMIAGILVTARKVIKSIEGWTTDFKGVWDSIKDTWGSVKGTFDQLTSTLKTMQNDVKANIILKIAIAVAVLAGALWLLSGIPTEDLWPALAAIGALLGGLMVIMQAMSTMSFGDDAQLIKAGIYILLLSVAIGLLADSVKDLADLDWQELAKGLVGVGVLLAGLTLFSKYSNADSAGLSAGLGLLLLGVALKILVGVVEDFGTMDVGTMLKGLGVVIALIGAMTGFSAVLKGAKGIFAGAAAMLVLAGALWAMQWVIEDYAKMDLATFGKGIGLIAGAVVVLGVAMRALPVKSVISGAISLGILAIALWGIVEVLEKVAAMGDTTGVLVTLGVTLGLLIAAVMLASGAMAGALALIVVAGALWLIALTMEKLGSLDLTTILIALGAMAAVFLLLGVAGLLIAPVVPVLLALGIALGILGLAMILAGVGFLAFATGFALFASVGVAGIAVIIAAFEGIIALIPLMAEQIGLGIMAFAKVISESGPAIIEALSVVLASILQAITDNIPAAVTLIGVLIMALVAEIARLVPYIAEQAMIMMTRFLQIMRAYIPDLVTAAYDLMIDILNTLQEKIPEVIQAMGDMIVDILAAMQEEIPRVVEAGTDMIVDFLQSIEDELPSVMIAASSLIRKFIDEMATTIENLTPWIVRRALEMGRNIVAGVGDAIWDNVEVIRDALLGILGDAWDSALSFLGIRSPSRLFMWMGEMMMKGGSKGMDDNGRLMEDSAKDVGKKTVTAMQNALAAADNLIDTDLNLSPVITPVIDLTEAQKNIKELNRGLEKQPMNIDPAKSRLRAADTRSWLEFYRKQRFEGDPHNPQQSTPETPVQYTQNNYSPKALSRAEIYRQTKNQLSTLKGDVSAVHG